MVYSNNIFRLLEYEFTDLRYYNSLRLVQERNYSLEEIEITLDDLYDVWARTKVKAGTGGYLYPGGQLLQGYFTGGTAERESNDGRGDRAAFGFKERQSDYYFNACRYPGAGGEANG